MPSSDFVKALKDDSIAAGNASESGFGLLTL
jgi:hypothetical protein